MHIYKHFIIIEIIPISCILISSTDVYLQANLVYASAWARALPRTMANFLNSYSYTSHGKPCSLFIYVHTRRFHYVFSIDMNNNVLTNMNDILSNMVFMWLDILDLLPQQCSYTLAVEGWTALPAGLFHNQRCLIVINIRLTARLLGPVSISEKTSFRKIS